MRSNSMVRITQVSNDGESFEDFAWRDQFEVPASWQPIAVQGVYGRYSFVGSEASGQDHVSWSITVDRCNGVIRA